jgi:transposase InsO family protein
MGRRLHLLSNAVELAHLAFVIDCFSRAIVGWHTATAKDTGDGHHRVEDGTVAS